MAKRDRGMLTGDPATYEISSPAGGVQMETFIPWTLIKRGVKRQVITPIDASEAFRVEVEMERREREADRDTPLLRVLGLAHYWQWLLDEGTYRSVTEIATAEGMDLGQASRIVRLTQLAPDIIEACLADEGIGPALGHLMRRSLPAAWSGQRQALSVSMV
ncbi:MAG: LacI family transcriptional regulator [Gammaproteobacteria bacterium]